MGRQIEVLLTLLPGGPQRCRLGPSVLTVGQWEILDKRAAENRLRPLLHALWAGHGAVPESIRAGWAEAYRESAIAALHQRAELIAIVERLANAGIHALALKGAWLAWHAYDAPAERPLRDLDLLVPAGRAAEAQRLLLAEGFEQDDAGTLPLEEWARRFKHLPALTSPQGTVVELHSKLWDEDPRNPPQPSGLFERAISDPDHPRLRYPAPPDMLMHLAVHAAFHRFDGGPLMLADFERLVAAANFDWPNIWLRAEQEGWLRAVTIALEGAQYWLRPGLLADVEGPIRAPKDLLASLPWLLVKPRSARERDIAAAKLARSGIGPVEKLRRALVRRRRLRTWPEYLRWLGRETARVLMARLGSPVRTRRIARLDAWLSG